jgi:hypothetical protein
MEFVIFQCESLNFFFVGMRIILLGLLKRGESTDADRPPQQGFPFSNHQGIS